MTAQFNKIKKLQKAFTLIELIVVIAVLGVLAAAVLTAIDPVDKINAGNDSKVQTDVNEMYSAIQRLQADGVQINSAGAGISNIKTAIGASPVVGNFQSGDGTYIEMKSAPAAPSGYAAYSSALAGTNDVTICGQQKSKANELRAPGGAVGTVDYFCASNGKTCYLAAAGGC